MRMKQVVLTMPRFAFIVATRAALAAGAGLLLSSRFPEARRRIIGAALVGVGAVTTIPAVMSVRRGMKTASRRGASSIGLDRRLVGATRFARKGDEVF
jgi:hypothetical protein